MRSTTLLFALVGLVALASAISVTGKNFVGKLILLAWLVLAQLVACEKLPPISDTAHVFCRHVALSEHH